MSPDGLVSKKANVFMGTSLFLSIVILEGSFPMPAGGKVGLATFAS
jgi:hypothetical protein